MNTFMLICMLGIPNLRSMTISIDRIVRFSFKPSVTSSRDSMRQPCFSTAPWPILSVSTFPTCTYSTSPRSRVAAASARSETARDRPVARSRKWSTVLRSRDMSIAHPTPTIVVGRSCTPSSRASRNRSTLRCVLRPPDDIYRCPECRAHTTRERSGPTTVTRPHSMKPNGSEIRAGPPTVRNNLTCFPCGSSIKPRPVTVIVVKSTRPSDGGTILSISTLMPSS